MKTGSFFIRKWCKNHFFGLFHENYGQKKSFLTKTQNQLLHSLWPLCSAHWSRLNSFCSEIDFLVQTLVDHNKKVKKVHFPVFEFPVSGFWNPVSGIRFSGFPFSVTWCPNFQVITHFYFPMIFQAFTLVWLWFQY